MPELAIAPSSGHTDNPLRCPPFFMTPPRGALVLLTRALAFMTLYPWVLQFD
jgi:hypothetical protein